MNRFWTISFNLPFLCCLGCVPVQVQQGRPEGQVDLQARGNHADKHCDDYELMKLILWGYIFGLAVVEILFHRLSDMNGRKGFYSLDRQTKE